MQCVLIGSHFVFGRFTLRKRDKISHLMGDLTNRDQMNRPISAKVTICSRIFAKFLKHFTKFCLLLGHFMFICKSYFSETPTKINNTHYQQIVQNLLQNSIKKFKNEYRIKITYINTYTSLAIVIACSNCSEIDKRSVIYSLYLKRSLARRVREFL